MNMIERVARVLNGDDEGGWKWEKSGYRLQQMELEHARRVIAAMRTIDVDMARAGWRAIFELDEDMDTAPGVFVDTRANACWQAMIDAALEPPIGLEKADD